jgi:hypothetical protein
MLDGEEAGEEFDIPYAKLFGSHSIVPPKNVHDCIYLVRDGRDVALSCYNWKGSMPQTMEPISFSEYIRTPIDWLGTFGHKDKNHGMRIFEHWKTHVDNYIRSGMFVVQYEELLLNRINVIHEISEHFGLELIPPFDPVTNEVGWEPTSKHDISKWREVMDVGDLVLFNDIVPKDFVGRW